MSGVREMVGLGEHEPGEAAVIRGAAPPASPEEPGDRRRVLLLERASAGDQDAIRCLYEELHPQLLRFAQRRTSSPIAAEDIAANTFRLLLERIGSYDESRGSVTAWALMLARSRASEYHRHERREAELAAVQPGAVDGADPVEQTRRGELLAVLEHYLLSFPTETRRLLLLRYVEDKPFRELAAISGMTEHSIRQRLSRCLRELRRRFRALEDL